MSNDRVLVFCPHPDDEAIGCGGAIRAHVCAGATVVVVYIAAEAVDDVGRSRRDEADRAGKRLGVSEQVFLDHQPGFVECGATLERALIDQIRRHRPAIVYAPHELERHPDHAAVGKIVGSACMKAAWNSLLGLGPRHVVEEIRYFEVWTPLHAFNLLVDISPHVASKVAAIEEYGSQTASVDYAEAAMALNRFRALMYGSSQFAEAFRSERTLVRRELSPEERPMERR